MNIFLLFLLLVQTVIAAQFSPAAIITNQKTFSARILSGSLPPKQSALTADISTVPLGVANNSICDTFTITTSDKLSAVLLKPLKPCTANLSFLVASLNSTNAILLVPTTVALAVDMQPSIMILTFDASNMNVLASSQTASFFKPRPPSPVDPAIFILFAIVMIILHASASITPHNHPLVTSIRHHYTQSNQLPSDTQSEAVSISSTIIYVATSSVFLLLVFWFPSILVYAVMLSFVVSGSVSVAFVVRGLCDVVGVGEDAYPVLATQIVPDSWTSWLYSTHQDEQSNQDQSNDPQTSIDTNQEQNEVDRIVLMDLLTHLVGIATTLSWYATRTHPSAYILLNIIGSSLIIYFLTLTHIPDIRISTVFLASLFLYDIFWVFGSKPFTSTGVSVMEAVAMGTGTLETMPMLIRVPRIWDDIGGFVMLGYGDVVIPGFVIMLTRALDLSHSVVHSTRCGVQVPAHSRANTGSESDSDASSLLLRDANRITKSVFPFINPSPPFYYFLTMIGYAFGLVLSFAAVYITQMGQPALLYLVPCTLIPIYVYAWWRGEFWSIWSGLDRDDLKQE